MGLEIESIELLIEAKKMGVRFDRILTIGRQRMLVSERALQKILFQNNLIVDRSAFKLDRYAESFYELLGSRQIDALDASDYEGATVIQDLNDPIQDQYKSKYDVVFDGGSLEHVFNFPMAIKNCMDSIGVGGYYLSLTPTNNFMGHGFYQFSPELYFRVFNSTNGFRLKKMFFYTRKKGRSFYEVVDPSVVNQRVGMVNSHPSFLFIIAQKVENAEVFKKHPQQYEYENIMWKKRTKSSKGIAKAKFSLIKRFIPKGVRREIKRLLRYIMDRYRIVWFEIGTGKSKYFKR